MIVFYLVGFLLVSIAIKPSCLSKSIDGTSVNINGRITDVKESKDQISYILSNNSLYKKILVFPIDSSNQKKTPNIGDLCEVSGKIKHFQTAVNDGMFDVNKYYRSINVELSIIDADITVKKSSTFSVKSFLYIFRKKVSNIIDKFMGDEGEILKGILLGDKSGIEEDDKKLFVRGGLSHILAVSGMHISNISIILGFLLEKLRIKKLLRFIIMSVFLFLYAILTGFTPSVFRAVLMYIIVNYAVIRGERYDLLTSVSISIIIYSFFFPLSLFQSGMILSYGCIISIYFFSLLSGKSNSLKPSNSVDRIFRAKILTPFLLGLFMYFFMFPIVISNFYLISLLSVFVNIYVISIMTVLFIFGLIGIALSPFTFYIPKICFSLCRLIIISIKYISRLTVIDINTIIITGRPKTIFVFLYYIVFFLILFFLFYYPHSKTYYMFLIILPFILLLLKSNSNKFTMLDVDQGECLITETKDGKNIMIDCGSLGVKNVFKKRVEPYLLYHGIACIDYVFLSHSDEDHINGIGEMLSDEQQIIKVKNIVLTNEPYDDHCILKIVEMAKKKKINILKIKEGDYFRFSDLTVHCLSPGNSFSSYDSNENSMILLLKFKNIKILCTGDASKLNENNLNFNIDSDILKVSHHGSKTASSEDFLNRVSPSFALISCGTNNRYGHPSKEVILRLKNARINTLITKDCGQITIKFCNNGFKLYRKLL